MREDRVLYQIKSLEKLILRSLSCDIDKNLIPSITPTQIQIIEYILEHDSKYIYQKDLEEVLNLRRATVSGVLQTMEKNGLLKRVVHQDDARAKRIILNENARNIFSQKEKKIKEIEHIITKGISNCDLEKFRKVLNQMKENLKKQSAKEEGR